MAQQRLLILSCSERKRRDVGFLPAVERYDGPMFRMLRRYLRAIPGERSGLALGVLSAQFGWLDGNHPIPYYDCRLRNGHELGKNALTHPPCAWRWQYAQIGSACICAGRAYQQAFRMPDSVASFLPCIPTMISGTLGYQQTRLYQWLHESRPKSCGEQGAVPTGSVFVRGVEITLTGRDLIARIADSAAMASSEEYQPACWYIELDGRRLSLKWVISILTGLPRSRFHTSDALRALRRLGMVVSCDE